MTEPDPINDLKLVRAAAVEQRCRAARDSVESGENNKQPHASVSWLADIQRFQIEIETLDRAIADENNLRPK